MGTQDFKEWELQYFDVRDLKVLDEWGLVFLFFGFQLNLMPFQKNKLFWFILINKSKPIFSWLNFWMGFEGLQDLYEWELQH